MNTWLLATLPSADELREVGLFAGDMDENSRPENITETKNAGLLFPEPLTPNCSTETVVGNVVSITMEQDGQAVNSDTEIKSEENVKDIDTKEVPCDEVTESTPLPNNEGDGLGCLLDSSIASLGSEVVIEGKAVGENSDDNEVEDASPFFHRSIFSPPIKYRLKCQCGAKNCRKYLY